MIDAFTNISSMFTLFWNFLVSFDGGIVIGFIIVGYLLDILGIFRGIKKKGESEK